MTHNPSYLSKSRHDVYYFRYPLGNKRIKLSLRTRCPRQALKLAKALAYHSEHILAGMDSELMGYAEVKAMIEASFAKELARQKGMIDSSGPLPDRVKKRFLNNIALADHYLGQEKLADDWFPEDEDIADIVKEYALDLSNSEKDRQNLKRLHLMGSRAILQQLLAYSDSHAEFDFSGKKQLMTAPESKLGNVVNAYMDEIKSSGLGDRAFEDQRDCLQYLIDWLGADFQISKLDDAKARQIKDLLRETPKGRNKAKLTKGKPLEEQVELGKKHGLETISAVGECKMSKSTGMTKQQIKYARRSRDKQDFQKEVNKKALEYAKQRAEEEARYKGMKYKPLGVAYLQPLKEKAEAVMRLVDVMLEDHACKQTQKALLAKVQKQYPDLELHESINAYHLRCSNGWICLERLENGSVGI